MRRRSSLAVILCSLALGACGDDEPQPLVERTPPALPTATPTPTETPDSTPQATPPADPTAQPTSTPAPDPGGGDEEGNRPQLELLLTPEGVLPPRQTVPAFLGLRLRVRNDSGAERVVRLDGKVVLEIGPGEAATAEVEGLRPGRHQVEAGPVRPAILEARAAGR